MSCYHPKAILISVDPGTGESDLRWTGKDYYHLIKDFRESEFQRLIAVPCGVCEGCRIDYSRRWADRCVLELDRSKVAVFVTLTYDDEHLPYSDSGVPSLSKRDFQLFNKKLRDFFYERYNKTVPDYKKYFNPKKGSSWRANWKSSDLNSYLHWYNNIPRIRFFGCGEYGPTTGRPHGHFIYFGISVDDFSDLSFLRTNQLGQPLYTSETLESLWENGFISITPVSYSTCAYTARYTLKKVYKDSLSPYEQGAEKEFSLMSNRPGIGAFYFEDHPEKVEKNSFVFYGDENGSKKIKIPPYVFDKLRLQNPDLWAKIKEERKQFADDRFAQKLLQTDLDSEEYLKVEESIFHDRIKKLRSSVVL